VDTGGEGGGAAHWNRIITVVGDGARQTVRLVGDGALQAAVRRPLGGGGGRRARDEKSDPADDVEERRPRRKKQRTHEPGPRPTTNVAFAHPYSRAAKAAARSARAVAPAALVQPRSEAQRKYLSLLRDGACDVAVCCGPRTSGKTLLAMQEALLGDSLPSRTLPSRSRLARSRAHRCCIAHSAQCPRLYSPFK